MHYYLKNEYLTVGMSCLQFCSINIKMAIIRTLFQRVILFKNEYFTFRMSLFLDAPH